MADISQIILPDNSTYNIKDTTARTVMVGATSSEAGVSGQVPAPAAGDTDKYLKSDGTWATVSGGGSPTPMTTAEIQAAVTSGWGAVAYAAGVSF